MNRPILILLLCLLAAQSFPQQGQLSISRIARMPDLPSPLKIRDWERVTLDYDSLVFNTGLTGPHLPLSRLGMAGQYNYPDNTPLFLDTYVGAEGHLNQAEAINILPAIVGASLAGIDKSSQNGMNWVASARDFFNRRNHQNVYLNNYSASSGNDWWYDIMPNVYFYQLRSLYPDAVPEFDQQFLSVADRWLYCVTQSGGSTAPWKLPDMNYRAFNLITGVPLTTGVPEPESAGSIAWLLYNAYTQTGNRKYYHGAQLAMEFLTGLESNPSYELQLSYGTLVAARMNAVGGTDYPMQKLLDWCFNRGGLRGWGAITGRWGGYDVSGLIGEANDGGNDYAFVMNGFQQAAALAPLPKYDKRYAGAIAKWMLNLSNASRLFYWNALPETQQDSYTWAAGNDPAACIPYESMKETWLGKTPFATGDAMRGGWAATNLSLYSGSSVGYLAATAKTTNVPEILQIDLNKTDFYGDNALVSYLYYNPASASRQVIINLPPRPCGVYEAITETILDSAATLSTEITIPAGETRLVRLYAAVQEIQVRNGRLYAGNDILDYHYRYNFSKDLRIKALTTDRNPVAKDSLFTAFCEPGNVSAAGPVQYDWFLDDVFMGSQSQSQIQINAPGTPSGTVLKCRVTSGGQTAEDTIHLQIVDRIPVPPVVTGISTALKYSVAGGRCDFLALAEPAGEEILEYSWSASAGVFIQPVNSKSVTWQAPGSPGICTITVRVSNPDGLSTSVSAGLLVKDTSLTFQSPVIWYPFDRDDRNAAADRFHATASGVEKTTDARGKPSMAYLFTDGNNIIYTDNTAELNFTDAVSLSCWVKYSQLDSERFILSHGSWQQRYKLSITPEGRLRWTVKTTSGISDLDGSSIIEPNRYYHVIALYTGYSLELYLDGNLDTFKAFSGAILTTAKPFTIGRMDSAETLYSLRGSVDEVKVWDREIPVKQVEHLREEWAEPLATDTLGDPVVRIWPNPAQNAVHIEFTGMVDIENLSLLHATGRVIQEYPFQPDISLATIEIPPILTGIYFIRIVLKDGRCAVRKVLVKR